MKKMKINGESGDVRGETVELRKERLPELLKEYTKENIWKLDETACFWKALPDHGCGKRDHCAKVARKQTLNVDSPHCKCKWREGRCDCHLEIGNSRCFKGIQASCAIFQPGKRVSNS